MEKNLNTKRAEWAFILYIDYPVFSHPVSNNNDRVQIKCSPYTLSPGWL